MKCKHCGREIVRIRNSMGGHVGVYEGPVTYWPKRDGEEVAVMTPNGIEDYKSLTGEREDAEGLGYLPHTCHLLHLIYKGRDSWGRPVYVAPDGMLYVDVDPRKDREPRIRTKYRGDFDGEPCDPVEGAFIFYPKRDVWP